MEQPTATERMYSALNLQNKKAADLCRFLGISSSLMVSWKDIPPSKYLVNIAEFLDVSIDWLMTGEERQSNERFQSPPWELSDYQKEVAEKEFDNLLESQVALINAFEKLGPGDKEEIWALIDLKLKRRNLSSNSGTSKDDGSGTKTA